MEGTEWRWKFLLKDHHAGYISWEQYLENLRILKSNRSKFHDLSSGAARTDLDNFPKLRFQRRPCFLVGSCPGKHDFKSLLAKISLTQPNPLQPAYAGPILPNSSWIKVSVTVLPN
jgi:hypothetical protein